MPRATTIDSLTLGPWRRRRRMRRLLAQLDRAELRAARTSRVLRDRGRRLLLAAVATVVVAAVAGTLAGKAGLVVDARGLHRATPLGRPPKVVPKSGAFRFMQTQPHSDEPVAYDPCKPIGYVVNDRLAPAAGHRLLAGALATISRATGLHFVDDGTTDELPQPHYWMLGARRRPVLIAWTTPQVVPGLRGAVAGLGGSTPMVDDVSGLRQYVTGEVSLDTPDLVEVLHRPHGDRLVQAMITHELGHVVGLDHVADPNEIMYYREQGQVALGPGDRAGLAKLGSGRCFG